jgi:hypothetical protein
MAKCFFCDKAEATIEVENKVGFRADSCWEHYLWALAAGWVEVISEDLPKRLPTMDFNPLIESCLNYVYDLNESGWVDEDYPSYVFEEAMKCVFGPDIFTWITRKRA